MVHEFFFFLFDSHSDNIDDFNDPNGQVVFLEFRTMMSLNNFIKSFFAYACNAKSFAIAIIFFFFSFSTVNLERLTEVPCQIFYIF